MKSEVPQALAGQPSEVLPSTLKTEPAETEEAQSQPGRSKPHTSPEISRKLPLNSDVAGACFAYRRGRVLCY